MLPNRYSRKGAFSRDPASTRYREVRGEIRPAVHCLLYTRFNYRTAWVSNHPKSTVRAAQVTQTDTPMRCEQATSSEGTRSGTLRGHPACPEQALSCSTTTTECSARNCLVQVPLLMLPDPPKRPQLVVAAKTEARQPHSPQIRPATQPTEFGFASFCSIRGPPRAKLQTQRPTASYLSHASQ